MFAGNQGFRCRNPDEHLKPANGSTTSDGLIPPAVRNQAMPVLARAYDDAGYPTATDAAA